MMIYEQFGALCWGYQHTGLALGLYIICTICPSCWDKSIHCK